MDHFIESHLPHALQFMVCKHNENGETDDRLYPDEVAFTIPAGSDPKHVVKCSEEQKAFLEQDKQFKKLLELNKGGIRYIDKLPTIMLSEQERENELRKQINDLRAENAKLKAGV